MYVCHGVTYYFAYVCFQYLVMNPSLTKLMNSYVSSVVIYFLLLLCGDIEVNPGPGQGKLKSLTVCHVNIRGLNETKMRAIVHSSTEP